MTASGWCAECERQHHVWRREHAADIIWQAFSGAGVAMLIALGGFLAGLGPLVGIAGVFVGAGTFLGARTLSNRRRRRQFQGGILPRAYLRS